MGQNCAIFVKSNKNNSTEHLPSSSLLVQSFFFRTTRVPVPQVFQRSIMAEHLSTFFWANWRRLMAFFVPIILLPMFVVYDSKESRCAYGFVLISIFWIFQLVHTAVTSLLPVFIFPMLGILTTADISEPYMKDAIMMYLANMILTSAVEHCNLHYRTALTILLGVGASTKRMMLGLMLASMFLSMWVRNNVVTLMFLPIVDCVVSEISKKAVGAPAQRRSVTLDHAFKSGMDETGEDREESQKAMGPPCVHEENVQPPFNPDQNVQPPFNPDQNVQPPFMPQENVHPPFMPPDIASYEEKKQFQRILLLAVAYAASIGGTGSLVGTSPNLLLWGVLEDLYPHVTQLTFATWMYYNVPPMLLCVTFAWLYLYHCHVPKRYHGEKADHNAILRSIRIYYHNQDGMTFHEAAVFIIWSLTILVWFLRDPYFFSGWTSLFTLKEKVHGATPAFFSVALLFLIPARPMHEASGPSLTEWYVVQRKTAWDVLLLMGGSYALIRASEMSGLCSAVGSFFAFLDFVPRVLLVVRALRIHPLHLMLPVTVSVSYAFVSPLSTLSNTIVCDHGSIEASFMARTGIVVNIFCIAVQSICVHTVGVLIFHINDLPPSIEGTNSTAITSPKYSRAGEGKTKWFFPAYGL
ncbi:Na(+)/citrate cotransporter-like isoform X2 [Ornithodoros turicata]|uniref:Na(+)/citrate cotransporter-like isoform X2 n=1 Tax=Ornithodoros turicata TaxID=34597 RepID=UPI003139FC43